MKALRISRVSILGVLFVCACGKGDAGKPTSEVDVHMPEKAIGANGGTESAPLSPEATAVRATRENPFRAISDDALDRDIRTAVAEAKASGKRVLLDFVAEWCTDCREVLRVAELEPARTLLRDKYIVVPMNVGKWDRAVRWRDAYGVKRIATLVVLDGEGNRVAQTSLEPISLKQALTPEALAAWLAAPKDTAAPNTGAKGTAR